MWVPDRTPEEESVTFGEFFALANRYAAFYQTRRLQQQDTVILVMPQSIALMAAFAGALVSGIVPTILAYPTFKVDPEKYRYGLMGVTRNLSAGLTVLDQEFPDDLEDCVAGPNTVRFDPFASAERAPEIIWSTPDPDDVAFIQHSAGTTGLQKGVALSHRAVLTQLVHLADTLSLQPADRIVSWLPLYHDMGLIACFILPLVAHLQVAMQSPTDWVLGPASLLKLASSHRSTLCWLPNFAYQFMARRVHEDDREGLDLSSLRAVINCSEPVRAQSMEEFYQAYRKYGFSRSALQTSYAMAENTFAVTQSVADGHTSPLAVYVDRDTVGAQGPLTFVSADSPAAQSFVSSGACLKGNQVRILDDDGQDLPEAVIGEILVQSDSLFCGYYNRPDLTAAALRDGWYRTKDRGFKIGEELFVLGRKDDLIIIGGKNIYPLDVEEIAWTNSHIREGRVVAFVVDNPDLGTQELFVVAEVIEESHLEQGQEIQLEIRRQVLSEMGVAPRVVQLVPPKWIVKSTAGKPARSTSREKFFREHPELDSLRN
jgi:acyl-CoA synthetase (AMP-forming)/AMP-acid ligase II